MVAIDGPAGAGKSSAASGAAERLGFVRIDTGALYRAIAWAAHERGLDWEDAKAMGELASAMHFEFKTHVSGGSGTLFVDGEPRGQELRSQTVSRGASLVSRHPAVRDALLDTQRKMGAAGGVVLEGRDIGTVVFPDADVKVFLTASPEERARRRLEEAAAMGQQPPKFSETLKNIEERDRRDATRKVSPLVPANDAHMIDCTEMTLSQVVDRVVSLVKALEIKGGA